MTDFNKPFRITIEHYDNKIIIETNHSDITFDDYMDMLRKISITIYSEKLWNEYFEEKSKQ